MVLSLMEMRNRSNEFIDKFKDATDEKSDAQNFWRGFFNIFGVDVVSVAVFEQAVKKFSGAQGFIDCFWKGKLIIEHKSRGLNLDKAFDQALGYLDTLSSEEKPRWVIVSDFERIRLTDLFTDKKDEIHLSELTDNLQLFKFIYEDEKKVRPPQEKLNIEASELMGDLYDALKNDGYDGYELELFLVRLLFCVYAEDTGIFKPYQFTDYITNEKDITNVGTKIQMLFRILNQPEDQRQHSISDELKAFPYVNGKFFEKPIVPPAFNGIMFNKLRKIFNFDWSTISPAIFGSLFQSIIDPELRRELGAHYTSESNILKVVNSLFMNALWDEFKKAKGNTKKLEVLWEKIGKLEFFDPACGCGNFLIVAYKELRLLEYEILTILLDEDEKQVRFDSRSLSKIKLEHFHGIEIEEFPSLIAKLSMWLIQHQMDLKYETLDIIPNNLPLNSPSNIVQGNALRMDWEDVVTPSNNLFILSNPPFAGSSLQTDAQKEDLAYIFADFDKFKNLDYVAAWYKKALDYIQGTSIEVGFVSTNSICQGESVGLLWGQLNQRYDFSINFAHQSFKWSNEARHNAGVYVIIVGFSLKERVNKTLFIYDTPTSIPYSIKANNINSYLVDFEEINISRINEPICEVPKMQWGVQPRDDGNLVLTSQERKELLKKEPLAEKWIKPLASAKEFLNNKERYCLWLDGITPSELSALPEIRKRVENVRAFRLKSKAKSTRQYAEYPTLFAQRNNPKTDYILVPISTSENRDYIPISFVSKNVIPNNSVSLIPSDDKYIMGIIMSKMHMVWMSYVCGRLESRYRYSSTIVYNNYPFPKTIDENKREDIISKVYNILNVRDEFPNDSLANLYDPLLMPPELKKAHFKLDESVDKAYRDEKFKDNRDRIKYLFDLYLDYTSNN